MNTKSAGVDWPSVARMLGGGAMLGAGAGAAVTFLNHLKELKTNAEPPVDDNVLYLDVPGKVPAQGVKRASAANTAPTFALSSLAGLVGSALAYNTVRDVYNRRRKRELESDLTDAQHVYLGQNQAMKSASQYSMTTKMLGSGELALMLTALGSAVVANKMLSKRFPPLQAPTVGQPKKIVVRSVDPVTHQPLSDVSPDAMEGVARTSLADTKMAAHNELKDVVCAVAAGRADELKNLVKTAGVDGMLAAVKGASTSPTNPVDRNLAVTWICHDPLMHEALSPLVAAEFFKSASWTFDLLPHLSGYGLDEQHLIGLVEASTRAVRASTLQPVLEKMAAVKSAEEGISPMKTLFFAGALKSIMDDDPNKEQDSTTGHSPNVMHSEESNEADHKYTPGADLLVDGEAAHRWTKSHLGGVNKVLARQV